MKRLYVDIDTGTIRTSRGRGPSDAIRWFLRDIMRLQVVFLQGEAEVTADVLASGAATMRLGLKNDPSNDLLASATSYSLTGQIATVNFSLNTEELIAYFSDYLSRSDGSASFRFEVEVTNVAGTERETHAQVGVLVVRDVNRPDDIDPTQADDPDAVYAKLTQVIHHLGLSGIAAGAAPLTDLLTAGEGAYEVGAVVEYFDTDAGVTVRYRLTASTAATATPWQVRAGDFHVSSNPRVWALIDVRKPGAACLWNANTSKFHYAIAYGSAGAVGMDLDQTGFSLT